MTLMSSLAYSKSQRIIDSVALLFVGGICYKTQVWERLTGIKNKN
jgi:hypothetical protein